MMTAAFEITSSWLRDALEAAPKTTVRVEDLTLTPDGLLRGIIEVSDGVEPSFDRELRSDPAIERLHRVGIFDQRRVYSVRWRETISLYHYYVTIVERNGHVLAMEIEDGRSTITVRIPAREDILALKDAVESRGDRFTLCKVSSNHATQTGTHELTSAQYEALLLATQHGYFETPSEVTLDTLADELGITPQATSQRIRTGIKKVVEQLLREPRMKGQCG